MNSSYHTLNRVRKQREPPGLQSRRTSDALGYDKKKRDGPRSMLTSGPSQELRTHMKRLADHGLGFWGRRPLLDSSPAF